MGSTIGDRMIRSLLERSISDEASSVKSTFSSWDNCMAKTYCKWPVIAGIIVGSIIILGIVGCLVSCLCCGYQCCKGCCGCCYSCCDCGGSRHDRGRDKYAGPPPPSQQPYYQQPPPPEPMNFGYRQTPATAPSVSSGPPPAYRGPATATFDQPSKTAHVHVNEDELPPMPTWADAQTRRVEDHHTEHEEVEMENLQGIRDRTKSPLYHNGASPAPVAGGLSRGLSRGGYDQVPGTYPSPHPSPQPLYDEGYSHNSHTPTGHGGSYGGYNDGAMGGSLSERDAYFNSGDQGHYGNNQAETHYFNQNPHSPGAQSPGYGPQAAAGYAPRNAPAPYRGFENQPAPRVQVPNFSGTRAYNQAPSPRSPPAMGGNFSPYDQQRQQQQNQPPGYPQTRSPPPASSGYSPYDHQQSDYHQPTTQSPPPLQQQGQQGPQGQYRAFSPRIASPPPLNQHHQMTSFLADPDHHQSPNGEDRPPSLLMAGRRPAPNTYRAV